MRKATKSVIRRVRKLSAKGKLLLNMVKHEKDTTGRFKKLLWTHNTPYVSLIDMLAHNTPYIRCCVDGKPYGRGAQFRYGLDSQYGDIIFIMKAGDKWYKDISGVSLNEEFTENPAVGRFFDDSFPIEDYHSPSTIRKFLSNEARNYTFRSPTIRGDGTECVIPPLPKLSWCNSQMHLGENVSFDNVYKVLVPRWLEKDFKIHDNVYVDRIIFNDWIHGPIRYPNRNVVKEFNKLREKVEFYGPSDIQEFYDYVHPSLGSNYEGYDYSLNKSDTHTRRNPSILGNSSKISLSAKAFREAEKIYMRCLIENKLY